MAHLVLDRLDKIFGTHHAIDSLTLDVPEGDFVSFLGPSGCGKTTTLRCIAGLEQPTSGAIRFSGRDVTGVPVEQRNIGMVFQNYALFPHMTVAENVAFGLDMRGVSRADAEPKVRRVLDMVQLPNHADRYPRELSGGQQQRVALARALVFEPDILLLDEPLANLDARLRDEMRSFIRQVQRSIGITTVYVTHDQSEAMTMSDQIVVMFDGKAHQADSPEAIYNRPATSRVANFIGAANIIAAKAIGAAEVQTGFGVMPAQAAGPLSAGSDVQLVLRPEDIALSGESMTGSFPLDVTAVEYLGSIVQYRTRTSSGEALDVQAMGGERFPPGAKVFGRFTGQAGWVLP